MKKMLTSIMLAFAVAAVLLPANAAFADALSAGRPTVVAPNMASSVAIDADGLDNSEFLAAPTELSDELAPSGYAFDAGDYASDASAGSSSRARTLATQAGASGTCGENATWSLDGGVLTIAGSGDMTNFSGSALPGWNSSKSSITSVVIGADITSIGSQAFANCRKLVSVEDAQGVATVGSGAFYGCSALASIALPSAQTIASGAFANCSSLTSFSSPELTFLGQYAFQGTAIKTFEVPRGLESVDGAFYMSKIQEFTVAAGNTVFTANDGVLYANDGKSLVAFPGARTGSFSIPPGVTEVSDWAFLGCVLASVDIPDTVAKLGESAFQGCSKLKSIDLPDSITDAGYFTFNECTALKSVRFGTGLKTTPYQMFRACTALESIDFGGLEELGAHAFVNCTALKSVVVPATVKAIGSGAFGCDANKSPSLASVSLLGVKEVPFTAFLNQKALTHVELGPTVTSIYRGSFVGCTSLLKVELPESVTFVHHWAFEEQTELVTPNEKLGPYGANGLQEQECVRIECTSDYSLAFQVLALVNEQRAANGLSELHMDASLLDAAMVRAGETAVLFSHTRPDSSTCFTADKKMIAENIACYQTSAAAVMNAWMNSSGHKANILSASATTIGIGCVDVGGSLYWTQCFGGNELAADCEQPADSTYVQAVVASCRTFGEAETSRTGTVWSSGKDVLYSFAYGIELEQMSIVLGETVKAKIGLTNPGLHAKVGLAGVDEARWTCADVATTSADDSIDGTVSCTLTGTSPGTGSVQWHGRVASAQAELTVVCLHLSSVTVGALDPTCEEDGSTGDVKCAVCGEALGKATVIPALGHDWAEWTSIKEPTCTEPGTMSATCSRCGVSRDDIEIPALGHDYVTKVVSPTNTENGYTRHTCSRCGDEYVTDELPSLNHQAANEVAALVQALPSADELMLSDAGAVFSSRRAYDVLTDEQKTLLPVGILATLEAAEARIAELQEAADEPPATGLPDGSTAKVGGATYEVKSDANGAAIYQRAPKAKKSVTIPASVKLNGKSYKVVGIAAGAFKGTKARTITVKADKLTKKSVKGCFKGAKRLKTVKVKVGAKKLNKKFVKKYKKIFTRKNAGRKVAVK